MLPPRTCEVRSSFPSDAEDRASLIHREILQLGVLIVVAVAAFLVTRAVAESNRDTSLRDAAEWYRRGQQQIEAGRLTTPSTRFVARPCRDRNDKRYALALAHALALNGENDAARGALLTLRESAPEDPEINLQLARLAAGQPDVTEALRFYHNALYAPWPVEQADARRRVRFELIGFLLAHDQTSRALSELLAVNTDLPDDAGASPGGGTAVCQGRRPSVTRWSSFSERSVWLLRATTRSRAPEKRRSSWATTRSPERICANCRRRRTTSRNTRDLVELVLSNDPLAKRLGSAERRRRLAADFAYAQQRLSTCLGQRAGGQLTDEERALQDEDPDVREPVEARRAILEQDTVETGVDLIDRIEHQIVQMCGPQTTLDHALSLIGRTHGADAR